MNLWSSLFSCRCLQEFTDSLVEDEQLPASEKDKFKEYLKGEVKAAKLKIREVRRWF